MGYGYLLRAGWQMFVRHQRLDPWLHRRWEGDAPSEEMDYQRAYRAARWVNAAARRPFPWARCLQRSVALCLWLEHERLQPELRIGVFREGEGIDAHAWVEYKGHVLNDSERVGEVFSTLNVAQPLETRQDTGEGATDS